MWQQCNFIVVPASLGCIVLVIKESTPISRLICKQRRHLNGGFYTDLNPVFTLPVYMFMVKP